jgi:hypothetical protein
LEENTGNRGRKKIAGNRVLMSHGALKKKPWAHLDLNSGPLAYNEE